jgi:hypothetical protein
VGWLLGDEVELQTSGMEVLRAVPGRVLSTMFSVYNRGFFSGGWCQAGVQVEVQRSPRQARGRLFVGRPSLRDGLRFLRMTEKKES